MPDQEKEKTSAPAVAEPVAGTTSATTPVAKPVSAPDEDVSSAFFVAPLVGFDPSEITGTLIVIEGMDGSGRSTQISLLQEWLESEGFSVQTSGLRRSNLVGRDIDEKFVSALKVSVDEPGLKIGAFKYATVQQITAPISAGPDVNLRR